MIELTEQQRQALEDSPGAPVRFYDPQTKREFVIASAEWFESQGANGKQRSSEEADATLTTRCDPLLLNAMKAFWAELPSLLKGWWKRGKWVAYHGERRIGIARCMNHLIDQCRRQGIDPNQAYYAVIEPLQQPPWEEKEADIMPLREFEEESTPP
jgi:hypothetical protein